MNFTWTKTYAIGHRETWEFNITVIPECLLYQFRIDPQYVSMMLFYIAVVV